MKGPMARSPLYLESVRIDGFRSCEGTAFAPHPALSVLIGPNGSGKTNILQGIALLTAWLTPTAGSAERAGRKAAGDAQVTAGFRVRDQAMALRSTVRVCETGDGPAAVLALKDEYRAAAAGEAKPREWVEVPFPFLLGQPGPSGRAGRGRNPMDQPLAEHFMRFYAAHQPEAEAVARFRGGIRYYSASQLTNPARCPSALELDAGGALVGSNDGSAAHRQFVFDLFESQTRDPAQYAAYLDLVGPRGLKLVSALEWTHTGLGGGGRRRAAVGDPDGDARPRAAVVSAALGRHVAGAVPGVLSAGGGHLPVVARGARNRRAPRAAGQSFGAHPKSVAPQADTDLHALGGSVGSRAAAERVCGETGRPGPDSGAGADGERDRKGDAGIARLPQDRRQFRRVLAHVWVGGMNVLGVIAEDHSDVDVIDILTRKIAQTPFAVRRAIAHGSGDMQKRALERARVLHHQGCTHLMLVRDSDDHSVADLSARLTKALEGAPIARRAVVIPVRAIEAWLLADHAAVNAALKLRPPIKPQANPQGLLRPKEHLGALIDRRTARHIYYTNTVHNVRIASTCRWRS